MGKGGRDEEVASSKDKTELKTRVQKSIPYRLKNHTFGAAHTYIANIREYAPRASHMGIIFFITTFISSYFLWYRP